MSKRVRRFDPSSTGLDHVLMSRVLPQIETKRTLSQRFKEHTNLDKPTGVGDHCRATGHSVSMKNTEVLTRESNWHKRKVKEAIYIKQRAPTMNRDQGYHLPAIYNQSIPPKSEATHVTSVRDQGP